jgi:hypothetical protein
MGGRTAALVAAALVGVFPATARAGPRADFEQFFSTPVPGASTGIETKILYKNPADPNGKPVPVREEVFTFPDGTGFDDPVVPMCTASDLEVELTDGAACPAPTWVGRGIGDTTMTGFPGAGETPIDVDGWNADDGVILLGGSKQLHLRFATRAIRHGHTITVQVPRTPGGPPDGESALRRVDNAFGARSLGTRAYLRTPGTCPASGAWTFTARFTFADGVVENDSYDMPCTRTATPPRIVLARTPHRGCVSRRLDVRVRVAAGSPLQQVRLLLDGRQLRTTRANRFTAAVRLQKLRPGRHLLTVTAQDSAGQRARERMAFRRCGSS